MHEGLKQQKQILEDLNKKIFADISRAMNPSLDLVSGVMGVPGIYAVTQKLAGTFVQGAAMSLAAMKGKDKPNPDDMNDDDVLFCGIVAILLAQEQRYPDVQEKALEIFQTIRSYPYKAPWNVEH